MSGSQLILGNQIIWENPSDLGHCGIKLRKQILELQICERIEKMRQMQRFIKRNDLPLERDAGTESESPEEIRRSFSRRGIPLVSS